jgi:hypothetical protein
VNRFTRQTIPTVNRRYLFMDIPCTESFCSQKAHRQRCSSIVHSSRTIAILTTKTNLWTTARESAIYRIPWSWNVLLPSDTHKILLRPLQLLYFHLWPIYSLSLVNYVTF